MPTSPLAQHLPAVPERFSWSEDGQRAAYVVQRNGASLLQLVDATTTAWVPVAAPVALRCVDRNTIRAAWRM